MGVGGGNNANSIGTKMGPWNSVKKAFNLVSEGSFENDISYAYSGYAPLSVRLVQLCRGGGQGWRSNNLKLLEGPVVEVDRKYNSNSSGGGRGGAVNASWSGGGAGAGGAAGNASASAGSSSTAAALGSGFSALSSEPKVVLVVFIGGVTYGEL